MPLFILIGDVIVLMAASIVAYQTSKEILDYPPGYEISSEPISDIHQKNNAYLYPLYQNPQLFSMVLIAILAVEFVIPTDNEVIDRTEEDDIEPDTPEVIAKLESEINEIKTYYINTYKEKLEKLKRGETIIPALTEAQLLTLIHDYEKEVESLQQDIKKAKYYSTYRLTDDEKEQIKNTFAEKMLAIEKEGLEKKHCQCSIEPFITPNLFRRNMSDLSADYQTTLAGVDWNRNRNPKTNKISVEIKEWMYEGPAGKADFDGWLKNFCLLLEMKANYDSLMFSRTKFNTRTGQPELKSLGKEKIERFKKQAEQHDKICSAHPYARCCWVFMTPLAYNAFLKMLNKASYPSISAIWVPLS
ncbi:Tox-REase-5 domain-containing protein [Gilliamella sp. Pas-s27]|uniref:Tox-REase-5 domain-containing protein n=1 Tax=Gilliamella sp. Pas-s27 TaxID=2687311 RepID=UPI0013655B1E|nr:Tox-REase-5 domain-containing protein [Gilliamella sp. Pas-s27]MWP48049.1 hypothetical protein [Gilliamella sp. Pas-s27]